MPNHARDERERAEGDGSFREPTGWATAGYGKRSLSRPAAGGALFDNLFRFAAGISLGHACAMAVMVEAPQMVLWRRGGPDHPFVHGLYYGFCAACVIGAVTWPMFRRKTRRWLFTGGFAAAFWIGIVLHATVL